MRFVWQACVSLLAMLGLFLLGNTAYAQTPTAQTSTAQAPAAPNNAGPPVPDGPPLDVRRLDSVAKLLQDFIALPKTRGIAAMYAQQIAYRLPRGFRPAGESQNEESYAVLLASPEQNLNNWTTLLSLVGYRNAALIDGLTPQAFANALTKPKNSTCTQTPLVQEVGAYDVDGYNAYLLLTSCNQTAPEATGGAGGAPALVGRVSVTLIVKGINDFYVVEANFRGQVFSADTKPVSMQQAIDVAEQLAPIAICAISLTQKQCLDQQAQAKLSRAALQPPLLSAAPAP
jgi:hypothetical protein